VPGNWQALFGKGPTEQDPEGHLAGGLLHDDGGSGETQSGCALCSYPTGAPRVGSAYLRIGVKEVTARFGRGPYRHYVNFFRRRCGPAGRHRRALQATGPNRAKTALTPERHAAGSQAWPRPMVFAPHPTGVLSSVMASLIG
jgi:hypothetical protein